MLSICVRFPVVSGSEEAYGLITKMSLLQRRKGLSRPCCWTIWCCKVDASVAGEEAGFAAVHTNGLDIGDSWVSVGFSGVLEGELQGIALALHLAIEKEAKEVQIETDSLAAATAFAAENLPFGWSTFPLFSECLNLCKAFNKVVVLHVNQNENVLADKLDCWARMHKAEASGFLREVAPLFSRFQ
uniref:RNase H type-1 domain-containing protein n=1 Tax=Cannabis sativa TaxID=3483 RepID=A0A803NRY0_CANSA